MPEGASGVHGHQAIHGTQSFVGVMSAVWARPSITALEVLWRWVVGLPVLALAVWETHRVAQTVHVDLAPLASITVFQPMAAFRVIGAVAMGVLPTALPIATWFLPLCAVAWMVVAAFGRTVVLRRYDHALHARWSTTLVLGVLRATLLAFAWMLWIGLIGWAGRVAITGPAARGMEPNLILYCAIIICGTLLLYVSWAACSWPFQLAPLLAMEKDLGAGCALRVVLRSREVRGKLIEINLVMNIVKIAVLVLATVLSASPLPFSNVETQTFLTVWWAGVFVLYLVALDYFHVVHAVAYLSLWRDLGKSDEMRPQFASEIPSAERFTL